MILYEEVVPTLFCSPYNNVSAPHGLHVRSFKSTGPALGGVKGHTRADLGTRLRTYVYVLTRSIDLQCIAATCGAGYCLLTWRGGYLSSVMQRVVR